MSYICNVQWVIVCYRGANVENKIHFTKKKENIIPILEN